MSKFKRAKAVMLPTEKASNITIRNKTSELMYSYKEFVNQKYEDITLNQNQHLYIISDDKNDKIKEGDWYQNNGVNFRADDVFDKGNNPNQNKSNKKIIATTDSFLKITKDLGEISREDILSQPSQSFIEKYIECYNKGQQIIDVLVEYEEDLIKLYDNLGGHPGGHWEPNPINNGVKLKVNSKDNTITIKKVKDSWNREDVEQYIESLSEFGKPLRGDDAFKPNLNVGQIKELIRNLTN